MAEIRVPQVDFGILGDLGKTYTDARNVRTLSDLGKGLAEGTLDYRAAAAKAAQTGDLGITLKLLQLGEESKASNDFRNTVLPAYGGGAPQPAGATAPATPAMSLDKLGSSYGPAIASAESGGKYDAIGPVTRTGDQAYGKYQVMGQNIPEWTREVLGREMTPQAFAADPQAQEAVFKAKFGEYVQKYGPEGAAKAWFAGEKGMNNLAARDVNGTTVAGYADRFNRATGGQPVPPGGVPTADSGRIGTLLNAATHPRLPAPQRESAKILLQHELENSKMTNDQKEYIWARAQGEAGSFTDWMRKNKAAGATAITNDMRGENEESKALGKGAGERANTMMSAASVASKKLADINRSEALLDRLQQGKIEPARMNISAWAKSLGLPDGTAESLGLDPKGVGDAQALQALTAKSIVSMIGQGGFPANNFSDADREFLISTVERLSNDPKANKIILETARRVAQLDIAKAKDWQAFRRDPQNKGMGFADFEIAFNDKIAKADLFGDLRKQSEQFIGPPTQRGAAPPIEGARQAADGNFYVPDPKRPGKFLMVK